MPRANRSPATIESVPPTKPKSNVASQIGRPASVQVLVRAQVGHDESDAASGTVGRQQDLRQRAALNRDFVVMGFGDHRLSPPSTAITWPVMKPARSEQRNATAAATSSAVPSRLIGVNFTSSPTISSVRDPVVSSVR